MKHLVFFLLVACRSSSSSSTDLPPPTHAAPATNAVHTAPATNAVHTAPPPPALPTVDCSAQDHAAEYCAHVHDACCSAEGWTCDNDRYVDWFAARCPN